MSAEGLSRARAIFSRFLMPPCAETLGWHLIDSDPREGWVEIGFEGRPEFLNPAGFVQGGFLAAMLDDSIGPAVLVASDGALFAPTIQMNLSFLAPARGGALRGEGRVVRMGSSPPFLAGTLMDQCGGLVATASASARLLSTERLSR